MASQRELVINELAERDESSRSRYCDMQLAVYFDDNEPLIRVGGRWDSVENCYDDDQAETEVQIDLTDSQIVAFREFVSWMSKHVAIRCMVESGSHSRDEARAEVYGDERPYYYSMYYGGRRGGKSWLACLNAAIYALTVPYSRVVLVSPEQDFTEELRAVFARTLLPADTRKYTRAESTFELHNGSRIELVTGLKPNLKLGPVDFAIINEGQEINHKIFADMLGNVADNGGQTIIAANPPRHRKGQWVQDFYRDILSGEVHAKQFWFDPRANDFIDHAALDAMADVLGEAAYRREILGDMAAPVGDVVLTTWSDIANVIDRIPCDWVDVTEQITARHFGARAKRVIGADFDLRAGCSAISGRYFRHPESDIDDRAIFAIEWGARYPNHIEDDLPYLLAGVEIDGVRIHNDKRDVVIVADASGQYQSTERSKLVKDNPSWARLRNAGFRWVVPPDARSKRNPRSRERFDIARVALMPCPVSSYPPDTKPVDITQYPRLVVLSHASEVIESARSYPMKNATTPDRQSPHAHLVDCWSYVVWRRYSSSVPNHGNKQSGGRSWRGVKAQNRVEAVHGKFW